MGVLNRLPVHPLRLSVCCPDHVTDASCQLVSRGLSHSGGWAFHPSHMALGPDYVVTCRACGTSMNILVLANCSLLTLEAGDRP